MVNMIFENPQSNQLDSRETWADVCRVFAIFGVVLIHACGAVFYQYGKIPQGNWLAANLLDSLVRCSVPLFVMLSGALLLKPGAQLVTVRQIVRRINKVLVPLLMWNVGYLVYVSHFSGAPINWLTMLTQPPMYHLWFVYMVVGIYIFLPVFQVLLQLISNRRDLQFYLLVIWLVVTCVPVYWPVPLLALLQQNSFFGYGGYFLIGGIIASSKRDQLPSMVWFLVYFVGVASTFWLTFHLSERAHSAIETPYLYFSLNVFIASVAAFVLFTRLKISGRVARCFQWVGDRSFLIFFMHVVILERVKDSYTISVFSHHVPVFASILLIAIATFIISLIIATVIRLLPGSKLILG
jgi:surface polysaccharide O-acyltransferase-like enzyme